MAENPEKIPIPPNRIEDKAPKPKGVIPKNTQSLVIIGVAVLMILIMWLTGGGKKPANAPKPALPRPFKRRTFTIRLRATRRSRTW